MTIYFSSDHHFNHTNIISFANRSYKNVKHMNEHLVHRWNDTVSPDDTVYYLGDFALGHKNGLNYAERLNGYKILIPGNHDKCWPGHGSYDLWVPRYLDAGFQEVWPVRSVMFEGYRLTHLPYANSEPLYGGRPDKFSGLREDDDGTPLIHGHVHTSWKQKGHQVNVGVDVWDMRPVSFDTIKELLPLGT
jgi:calcineurin-like phosphoesterase family protein